MKQLSRNKLRLQRKRRIRAKVRGTDKVPRVAVFKSLRRISVQVIDDASGKTLFSVNNQEAGAKNDAVGAKKVGTAIAKKCLDKKISRAVFDRGGHKYHGKVKALADGAREAGLKF